MRTSFDAESIQAIAELVDALNVGRIFYIDAVLAGAAAFGGVRNPREPQWCEAIIASHLQPEKFFLELPPERWRQLGRPEAIFQALQRAGLLSGAKLRTGFRICESLGYLKEIQQRYRNRTLIRLEQAAGGSIDTLLDDLSKAAVANDDNLFGDVLAALASASNIEDSLESLESLLQRFAGSRPAVLVSFVRRLSKRLTDAGDPERALWLLHKTSDRLRWQRKDDEKLQFAKLQFLNERGNAFRKMLEYEQAETAYTEACELAGNDLATYNARVVRMNLARTYRDTGRLGKAIQTLLEILPHAQDLERFSCLFALALAHERNGEPDRARRLFVEAKSIVEGAPIDDELAVFWQAYIANAEALGLDSTGESIPNLLANTTGLSARQELLVLGNMANYGLRAGLTKTNNDSLLESAAKLTSKIPIEELARTDPEFGFVWGRLLAHLGKDKLAARIMNVIVDQKKDPLISMNAACTAAQLAARNHDWANVRDMVAEANHNMVHLVAATAGDNTISVTDAMANVRRLAELLARVPENEDTNRLCAAVADLQCSLRLSVDMAAGFLPSLKGAAPGIWERAPAASVQFLQFLDAGTEQVPLFVNSGPDGVRVARGAAFQSASVEDLGRRLRGRVSREPAGSRVDILASYAPENTFRKELQDRMEKLGLDVERPLLIARSPAVLDIPFQHALPTVSIAYVPSVSIGSALVALARESSPDKPETIAEVLCWRFHERPSLVEALTRGADQLKQICRAHDVRYECLRGTDATENNVGVLLQKSDWLKMSCHGVADFDSARFAFVLSDGRQDPPGLPEILSRKDLRSRFLYEWEEVAGQGRCRVALSTACTSGSLQATQGGEQLGIARSFLVSGVLAYVAPLWPVPGEAAQQFVNTLIERSLAKPSTALTFQLRETRDQLADKIPDWVRYAFVIHGYYGPLFQQGGANVHP